MKSTVRIRGKWSTLLILALLRHFVATAYWFRLFILLTQSLPVASLTRSKLGIETMSKVTCQKREVFLASVALSVKSSTRLATSESSLDPYAPWGKGIRILVCICFHFFRVWAIMPWTCGNSVVPVVSDTSHVATRWRWVGELEFRGWLNVERHIARIFRHIHVFTVWKCLSSMAKQYNEWWTSHGIIPAYDQHSSSLCHVRLVRIGTA